MVKWRVSGTLEVLAKSLFLWGNYKIWGKCAEGFEGVHGGNGIGKRNVEGRRLLEFCDERELCMTNTRIYKADKEKITYNTGECQTEIDFLLVGKNTESI